MDIDILWLASFSPFENTKILKNPHKLEKSSKPCLSIGAQKLYDIFLQVGILLARDEGRCEKVGTDFLFVLMEIV